MDKWKNDSPPGDLRGGGRQDDVLLIKIVVRQEGAFGVDTEATFTLW